MKVTPFKTLEANIDSVLFKLEEPRTEIQPAQPSKPMEVLQNNKYDHHYRVRISGIGESKEKSFIHRQFADKVKVEDVFKKLNVNCPIIETNRRGKFIEDRQRKLIATFSSPSDARLVISSGIQKKLFETDKILITTDLSPSDLAIERKLLSKRYELISNGVPKETLKIRYLKLYQGNKEVNIDWLTNEAKCLLINCQSLLSLNRRLSLLSKVNLASADIVLCTETWLDENFTQNNFPADNYWNINRSDRNTGSHGDVLILSRKCLKVRKVSLNADFVCSVIYNIVLIITIYNPPFNSDFRIKDIILTENIDKTISKAKCDNIVIFGDLNMPNIDWNSMTESTTSEYPLFLELITKKGYEQIIT